jgi:hypothetical protein
MFKIFDNFIPDYHQESIKKAIYAMRWMYNPNISGVSGEPTFHEDIKLCSFQGGFSGNIFDLSQQNNDPFLMGLCIPIIEKMMQVTNQEFSVERIRAGMFINSKENGIHSPHVDYYRPHHTILYYVNDSDGDTFLFNEKAEENKQASYPNSLSIMKKISPKMGRVVIFDGLTFHSSSPPQIHNDRLALNINVFNK